MEEESEESKGQRAVLVKKSRVILVLAAESWQDKKAKELIA